MGKIRYAARSQDELDARRAPANKQGIFSTLLTAIYETDPQAIAAVLPPPLLPDSEPLVRVTMASVDLGVGMPVFGAGTFAVQACHGSVIGNYPLVMPMTTEQAVIGGREVFGEPKKLADVGVEIDGDSVRGWFTRMGVTFVTIQGSMGPEIQIPADESRIDFYFKCLPSPDRKGFDSEPSLVYCYRDESTRLLKNVDGVVTLAESPYDPVADLPVLKIRSIQYAERSSSQRGEIVERVPGEWLEPYLHQRYDDPLPKSND
ncbi:MAG TPA: acetoacetate decarboxylase family protein [Acidimicrobiales bacterium]|nr:acetoacetate decarboxylase family protein [Acidimicrobiales bacterium]